MKTAQDPRHLKRVKLFKQLFSLSFARKKKSLKDLKPILSHLDSIDQTISLCAPEWPIDKLNKVDLAILRLAIFELSVEKSNPPKVIIDEAVELAKTYGTETTSKFVNGVLGSVLKR
jgi:N utilization substance protein B